MCNHFGPHSTFKTCAGVFVKLLARMDIGCWDLLAHLSVKFTRTCLCRTSLVPLAFPCFGHSLIRMETEGLLDYQGRAGIISIVRWSLRPVIFGVEPLRWLDSRESIRRFARITWFSRIVSGFPNWTPFLRIACRATNKLRTAGLRWFVRIARTLWFLFYFANRFARIDSRESPRFALRIARPSKSHLRFTTKLQTNYYI